MKKQIKSLVSMLLIFTLVFPVGISAETNNVDMTKATIRNNFVDKAMQKRREALGLEAIVEFNKEYKLFSKYSSSSSDNIVDRF